MALTIYIEGGGDGRDLKIRCRRGFRKLLEKMNLPRMPGTVACGGRGIAFDKFETAVASGDDAVLLVDSEDPVRGRTAWAHLKARDDWDQPTGTRDDQAQLMVTSMETWIVADHDALRRVFGADLRENALPPLVNLEARSRQDVLLSLQRATRDCGRDRMYRKGDRSFEVLAELDPTTLKEHLPHFKTFNDMLKDRL
jgi:hypothetical protein